MANEGKRVRDRNVTRGYGILEGFLAKQRAGMADALIPAGPRKGRILDLGSGTCPFFLTTIQFAEKHGLDRFLRAFPDNGLVASNITVKEHDLEAEAVLPFDDEFFDVVTMLAVFEHIAPEHLPAVLSQIHRVLKNGGLFIITTPPPWSHGLLRVMARLRLVSPLEIEEHKTCYGAGAIAALLMAGDFLAENIRFGYFELGMNLWLTATK